MRQIYPGVFVPTMSTSGPSPSSKARRYVDSYTDARFEAWERSREEAELQLRGELSAYEAKREALRLTIEQADRDAQAARKAAQDYREGGLTTLEAAARFAADASNDAARFNTSERNDAAQFSAAERNDAAQFNAGEANRSARAAMRSSGERRLPKGLDEAAVESYVDGAAKTSTAGLSPYTIVKMAFDTADKQSDEGVLTRDRQPYTEDQQSAVDGMSIGRLVREGQVTEADLQGMLKDPAVDSYTKDRLIKRIDVAPVKSGSGAAAGASAPVRGVGSTDYDPEGYGAQTYATDEVMAERARLAALRDAEAQAAEDRRLRAEAALEALGYPQTDLLARQRSEYQRSFTSGGGSVEALYAALLREERESGLTGLAAERSARKRLLAGDKPGNPFDDPTLSDAMPARDRTTGPGVDEVIDLTEDDIVPRILGSRSTTEDDIVPRIVGAPAPEDEVEFAPTDLSMITQEDSPIEFAPTDLSMIEQRPSFNLPSVAQVEDALKMDAAASVEEDEPEPTPEEVDRAQKIEALIEARDLSKRARKVRRLSENTDVGRIARDLLRANAALESPRPMEDLRQQVAQTYSDDPVKQRKAVVLLYAQAMVDKASRRQSVPTDVQAEVDGG